MKRRRNPIALTKLVDESAADLRAMLSELCNRRPDKEATTSSLWSRRFAASGKRAPAPKLRLR